MDEKTDIYLAENAITICEIENEQNKINNKEFIEDIFESHEFAVKRCCYHPYPLHNFDIIVDKVNSLQIDSKDKKFSNNRTGFRFLKNLLDNTRRKQEID